MNIFYRIGLIDDFHDVRAFIQCFESPEVKSFNSFYSKGANPNNSGDIGVFLNYNLIGRFKNKSEALKLVEKLISKAPKQSHNDFIRYDTISRWLI